MRPRMPSGDWKAERVAHGGSAASLREIVVMLHAAKGAAQHSVGEVSRTLEFSDANRERLPDAEMPRSPSFESFNGLLCAPQSLFMAG